VHFHRAWNCVQERSHMPGEYCPPWGNPPRTTCPSVGDRTVVEFGLTLVTVLIVLATGRSLETALAVPLVAMAGVRAAHPHRVLRGLLGPWTGAGRPVVDPEFY